MTLAIEQTAVSAHITINELEKLGASGGLSCLAPAGSFPVADLVAGNLSVLAAKGRGLPPQHDALMTRDETQTFIFNACGTICFL